MSTSKLWRLVLDQTILWNILFGVEISMHISLHVYYSLITFSCNSTSLPLVIGKKKPTLFIYIPGFSFDPLNSRLNLFLDLIQNSPINYGLFNSQDYDKC